VRTFTDTAQEDSQLVIGIKDGAGDIIKEGTIRRTASEEPYWPDNSLL
jgi:hypothetical protein